MDYLLAVTRKIRYHVYVFLVLPGFDISPNNLLLFGIFRPVCKYVSFVMFSLIVMACAGSDFHVHPARLALHHHVEDTVVRSLCRVRFSCPSSTIGITSSCGG